MTERQIHMQLVPLLDKLKQALRDSKRWSSIVPPQNALSSEQPFCCDTLMFEQWLQFILIERLEIMLEKSLPLPNKISITPVAEGVFNHKKDMILLNVIADIDELLSGFIVERSWKNK